MSIEDNVATELLGARDSVGLLVRPSMHIDGFDLERGYAVGNRLRERLQSERGWRPVGRKIGFTNRATWIEFGLQTPIWAPMYRETVHHSDDGSTELSIASFVAPRIEPEVVVRLADDLPVGPLPVEDIAGRLEWIAIGLEIVDCHYADWQFTAAEAVADFGVHAALVIGPQWPVQNEDDIGHVVEMLPSMQVSMFCDDVLVAEGEGRNALGSPLLALAHLAQVPNAPPLQAGQTITTGTLTPLPYIHAGQRWRVEVRGGPLLPLKLSLSR